MVTGEDVAGTFLLLASFASMFGLGLAGGSLFLRHFACWFCETG